MFQSMFGGGNEAWDLKSSRAWIPSFLLQFNTLNCLHWPAFFSLCILVSWPPKVSDAHTPSGPHDVRETIFFPPSEQTTFCSAAHVLLCRQGSARAPYTAGCDALCVLTPPWTFSSVWARVGLQWDQTTLSPLQVENTHQVLHFRRCFYHVV